MVKFVLVSLEGNIGAGKSTLFNIIKKEFPDAFILEEPVDTWQCINNDPTLNILEKFYQDPLRWGLTFQLFAYQSRLMEWERQYQIFEAQVNKTHNLESPIKDDQLTQDGSETKISNKLYFVFTERSLESSRTVFCKNLHKHGQITELEFQIYEQSFAWHMKNHKKYLVDQVIYLNTPSVECYRRLTLRGRSEELSIPLVYLDQLEERHNDWFKDEESKFEFLNIDGSQNYIIDPKAQETIILQIRECMLSLQQKFEQIN